MIVKVSLQQSSLGLNNNAIVREKMIVLNFGSQIIIEGSGSSSSSGSISWDDITDKPNFSDVAFSGDYGDLDNVEAASSISWDNITEKPNFSDVSFSGDYDDLNDAPTQLPNPYSLSINGTEYDGSQAVSLTLSSSESGASSWDDITGKPNFSDVAFSGDYDDLSGTPTIPSIEGLATEAYVDSKVEGLGAESTTVLPTYIYADEQPDTPEESSTYPPEGWSESSTSDLITISSVSGSTWSIEDGYVTSNVLTKTGSSSTSTTATIYFTLTEAQTVYITPVFGGDYATVVLESKNFATDGWSNTSSLLYLTSERSYVATSLAAGSYYMSLTLSMNSSTPTGSTDELKVYISSNSSDKLWLSFASYDGSSYTYSTPSRLNLADDLATEDYVDQKVSEIETVTSLSWEDITGKPSFADVAFSGSYDDLDDTDGYVDRALALKDYNDSANDKKIWTGTQSEYDSLSSVDSNIIYFIL